MNEINIHRAGSSGGGGTQKTFVYREYANAALYTAWSGFHTFTSYAEEAQGINYGESPTDSTTQLRFTKTSTAAGPGHSTTYTNPYVDFYVPLADYNIESGDIVTFDVLMGYDRVSSTYTNGPTLGGLHYDQESDWANWTTGAWIGDSSTYLGMTLNGLQFSDYVGTYVWASLYPVWLTFKTPAANFHVVDEHIEFQVRFGPIWDNSTLKMYLYEFLITVQKVET